MFQESVPAGGHRDRRWQSSESNYGLQNSRARGSETGIEDTVRRAFQRPHHARVNDRKVTWPLSPVSSRSIEMSTTGDRCLGKECLGVPEVWKVAKK